MNDTIMKRLSTLLMAVVLVFSCSACEQKSENITFTQWTSDTPAIEALTAYVENASNEASC